MDLGLSLADEVGSRGRASATLTPGPSTGTLFTEITRSPICTSPDARASPPGSSLHLGRAGRERPSGRWRTGVAATVVCGDTCGCGQERRSRPWCWLTWRGAIGAAVWDSVQAAVPTCDCRRRLRRAARTAAIIGIGGEPRAAAVAGGGAALRWWPRGGGGGGGLGWTGTYSGRRARARCGRRARSRAYLAALQLLRLALERVILSRGSKNSTIDSPQAGTCASCG